MLLTDYYQKRLKTIEKENAEKLLNVGESPLPKHMDKVMLAAMMQVVNTIYMLEETITRT